MSPINIRRLITTALVAIAFALVPATLSPTGALEVEELCASGTCQMKAGSFCFQDGEFVVDYRAVRGVG